MAPYIGRNTVVSFNSVVLNTNYRSAKDDQSIDTIDKSSGADTHKSYLAGLADSTVNIEFLMDGTVAYAGCILGVDGTLIYSPEGSASGKPKYTAVVMPTKRSRTNPYNDIVVCSVDFQKQAAWTEGTN